jgi:hypothetical protein
MASFEEGVDLIVKTYIKRSNPNEGYSSSDLDAIRCMDVEIFNKIKKYDFINLVEAARDRVIPEVYENNENIVRTNFKIIARFYKVLENYGALFIDCKNNNDFNNKLISIINSQDIKEVYSGLEILFLIPDYYANINNELLKITIYNLIRKKDPFIINYFIDNFNKIHPYFHDWLMFYSALCGIEQLFNIYLYVNGQNYIDFEEREDLLTYAILGGNRGIIKIAQDHYSDTLFNINNTTNMYNYGVLLFVICCKYDIELIEWFNRNLNIAKFLNDIKDVLNPGLNRFYNFESWMYAIDFNLYAKSLIYLYKKFVPNLPKILPSTLINLMYINGWNNKNDLINLYRSEIIGTGVMDKNLLGIVAEYYLPDEIYNDSTIKQQ